MLFGVVASNEDESRFFAVSASNASLALSYVQATLGSAYQVDVEALEVLIREQYKCVAELGTS